METKSRVVENWLTRKPNESAFNMTTFMTLVLLTSGYVFLANFFNTTNWMPANAYQVFTEHQYWRPWTALFAHGDLGHLLNNSLMFLPLTYLLTSYFGFFLFPVLGLLLGGVINLVVLKTMPADISLIGMSGVVYWMGAVWLTLFAIIDTRKTLRRRFAVALFLTVVLFFPQKYELNISYLSHFLGYILGIVTGFVYYYFNRSKFLAAEKVEIIPEETEVFISELNDVPLQEPVTARVQCPL